MSQELYDFKNISDVPAKSFVNIQDYAHITETLSAVPHTFHRPLLDEYHHHYSTTSRYCANQFFLYIQTYVKDKTFLDQSNTNLKSKARRYVRESARTLKQGGIAAGLHYLNLKDISPPNATNDHSLAARLKDEQWWMPQLIKKYDRQYEQTAIQLALVRTYKQVYVSTTTLNKVLARQKRSLEIMGNMLAVSDTGEEVEMLDILKGSPANPAVRRAELMNRLHGFEQYADAHQHCAEFYTLTAPSKYHANSSKSNHCTPRQVQQNYFSPLWAKIRAKLKYQQLNIYGFRITEPHGDACPHWHILLFMPTAQVAKVRAILKDYALRESGDEKGAANNRFDFESIDKNKGSAIGYIAKYISKNVDGFGMELACEDETGLAISESAQRVRAWASVWGIRQFQQIGGSSITVWRELRRLEGEHADPTIEAARQAADKGDWKAYLETQGGTDTLRKDQLISPYRCYRYNPATGEIETNQYGEWVDHIKGIMTTGIVVETRLKQWVIQRKPEDATTENSPLDNTDSDKATALAFALPWSSVNNCRNPQSQPIQKSNFLAKKPEIEDKKLFQTGEKFVKNTPKKV